MTQYNCPSCGAVIGIENVNVATDVALCKQCGQTTPLSILSDVSEMASVNLDIPLRGLQNNNSEIQFGAPMTDSAKQYIAAWLARQCHTN